MRDLLTDKKLFVRPAVSVHRRLTKKLVDGTDNVTRMWANAQPDGRPAEHRWRPLFNAAKFG